MKQAVKKTVPTWKTVLIWDSTQLQYDYYDFIPALFSYKSIYQRSMFFLYKWHATARRRKVIQVTASLMEVEKLAEPTFKKFSKEFTVRRRLLWLFRCAFAPLRANKILNENTFLFKNALVAVSLLKTLF